MSNAHSSNHAGNAIYANLSVLLLIVAGLIGNYLHFSIINAHFIFGSIFALLALQLFGFSRGVIAAALIASYTYIAWNHPWAIVTMTIEVVVVGWLFSHRKLSLLIADTLYWLLIGIPVGYVGFHIISHFPVSNSLFLLTKQAINGMANALIARLLFTGYVFVRRIKAPMFAFREIVANLLAFFALGVALIILTINSQTDFSNTDQSIRIALLQKSRQVADSLQNWIEDRQQPITYLAELAATQSPAQMQPRLEQAHASDANFLRIALIDQAGIALAYSPLVDELGQSTIGKNFADRPYIPALKQTLQPMLSDVMASRFGRPEPIVSMLVPVLSDGAYHGAVGGIMNFDRIAAILTIDTTDTSMQYTLVDNNSQVILSNRGDQTALTPFARGAGKLQPLADNLSQWVPALPPNTSTIELWGQSAYVVESSVGVRGEWTLMLEQPVAPFQRALYDRYRNKFFLLFGVLLVSFGLAEALSRRILRTIEHLNRLTQDLPGRLKTTPKIGWPHSAMLETHSLINNFRDMTASLLDQFLKIEHINASLEAQVDQRTAELRAREAALQESEQRFRAAFEQASIGMALTAPDGKLLKINQVFCDMLGYPNPEIQGINFADLTHPDDLDRSRECVSCLLAGERDTDHFYKRYRHRAGHDIWTEVHTSLLRDYQNQPLYFITHVQDVTERRQIEERLQETTAILQAAMDQSQAGIAIADAPDGKLRYVNRAGLLIPGKPETDLVDGVDIAKYVASWHILHGDGTPYRDDEVPLARAVLYGETCSAEFMIRRENAEARSVWANAAPIFDDAGKVRAGIVVFLDITDRKRAEEEIMTLNNRLHHLVDAIQNLASARTLEQVQRIVSTSARKLTGADGATMVLREGDDCYYADEETIAPLWKGKRFPITNCISGWVMRNRTPAVIPDIYADDRIPAEIYQPTFVKSLAMVPVNTQEPFAAIGNYWSHTHQPSESDLQLLQTLADATGRTVENIRLLEELEQRVRDRTAQLEASNKELEAFSYSVSHDLRAPLRGIAGLTDFLVEDYSAVLDAQGQKYCALIRESTDHMNRLIDDLLAFSRAGRASLRRKPIDMRALAQEIFAELTTPDQRQQITLNLDDLAEASGDPTLIRQVWTNLLSNAIKFTSNSAHPEITVTCTRDDQRIVYRVQDNGAGFDMQYLPKLFGVFQRLHSANEFEGTGVGLAIVQRIIQRHGGEVWAEGAPGQGATFSFSLPVSVN